MHCENDICNRFTRHRKIRNYHEATFRARSTVMAPVTRGHAMTMGVYVRIKNKEKYNNVYPDSPHSPASPQRHRNAHPRSLFGIYTFLRRRSARLCTGPSESTPELRQSSVCVLGRELIFPISRTSPSLHCCCGGWTRAGHSSLRFRGG